MKKLVIYLFVIFCLSFNSSAKEKWDNWDKALFSSYSISLIGDTIQTNYIFEHHNKFKEKNGVIRYMVKKTGRGAIPVYFVALNLVNYKIADHLKPVYIGDFKIPTRKIYLLGINAFSYDTVNKNYKLGIKMNF